MGSCGESRGRKRGSAANSSYLERQRCGEEEMQHVATAQSAGSRPTICWVMRSHWLKNVNDPEKETKVWRYAHYHSYTPWAAKRSILVSTLKKVDKMASDGDSLVSSALWKLAEFAKLRYPIQALLRACTLVAVTTRNATWFKVRGAFSK